mgnify:CR=1 FL=1
MRECKRNSLRTPLPLLVTRAGTVPVHISCRKPLAKRHLLQVTIAEGLQHLEVFSRQCELKGMSIRILALVHSLTCAQE